MLDESDLVLITKYCSTENFSYVKLLLNTSFEKRKKRILNDTSKVENEYILSIKNTVENLTEIDINSLKSSLPNFLLLKIESKDARECLEMLNRYITYYNLLLDTSSPKKDTINIPNKNQKIQAKFYKTPEEKPQEKQALIKPQENKTHCCTLF